MQSRNRHTNRQEDRQLNVRQIDESAGGMRTGEELRILPVGWEGCDKTCY